MRTRHHSSARFLLNAYINGFLHWRRVLHPKGLWFKRKTTDTFWKLFYITFWKGSPWRHLKCSNMIGQSHCLLPIRSFLSENKEKLCFTSLAKHWSVKQIANTFSRSYESHSNIETNIVLRLLLRFSWKHNLKYRNVHFNNPIQ